MPLISCPDCARQISDASPACPGCGCPAERRRPNVVAVAAARERAMAAVRDRAPTWSQSKTPVERRLRLLLPLGLVVVGAGVILCNLFAETDRQRAAAAGVEALLSKSAVRDAASFSSPAVVAVAANALAVDASPSVASDAVDQQDFAVLTTSERAKRARELCESGAECPSHATDRVIDSAKTPAERERLQSLVASIAAKRAPALAEQASAPTDRADTILASTPSGVPSDATFRSACKERLRAALKNPRGARFEDDGWFGPRVNVSRSSNGALSLSSWVESTNSFGATLRETYSCTYDPATRNVGVSLQ